MAPYPETLFGVSLCAGGAGLDLGVELALASIEVEYQTLVFVEREAYAAADLVARMEDAALGDVAVWDDIKTFRGGCWRGKIHCLTAGYPCQPFSFAGKRLGAADERHLWPDVLRVIQEAEPQLVFLENVAGHLSSGFDLVKSDLERNGYRVAAGIFSAAEVGASHRRERLFILAERVGHAGLPPGDAQYGQQSNGAGCGLRQPSEGDAMAHSQDTHRRVKRPECLPGGRNGFAGSVGKVADADGGGRRSQGDKEQFAAGADWTLPIFPPGPSGREAWAAILASRPDLAPAIKSEIRGMADGLAGELDCRQDRLRLTGNGVFPLQAAYAFLSLLAHFEKH